MLPLLHSHLRLWPRHLHLRLRLRLRHRWLAMPREDPHYLVYLRASLFKSIVTDECIGDSLSKSEYTVVNIGGPENPRLVSTSRLLLTLEPRLTRLTDHMYQDISRLRLEPGYAESPSIYHASVQMANPHRRHLPPFLPRLRLIRPRAQTRSRTGDHPHRRGGRSHPPQIEGNTTNNTATQKHDDDDNAITELNYRQRG
jgi:hypothetical protein